MLSILPEDFSFQLSYGVYVNNHYERKFIAKERIWKLKNKQLTYLLDAHNVRYSDTIILSPDSLKRLESFIKDAQFPSSISKTIEKKYAAKFGYSKSISFVPFPVFEERHLVESTKAYPISFNGKMRFILELSLDLSRDDIESAVMSHDKTKQYLEGRTPKKVIIVPGKIVNIVG